MSNVFKKPEGTIGLKCGCCGEFFANYLDKKYYNDWMIPLKQRPPMKLVNTDYYLVNEDSFSPAVCEECDNNFKASYYAIVQVQWNQATFFFNKKLIKLHEIERLIDVNIYLDVLKEVLLTDDYTDIKKGWVKKDNEKCKASWEDKISLLDEMNVDYVFITEKRMNKKKEGFYSKLFIRLEDKDYLDNMLQIL